MFFFLGIELFQYIHFVCSFFFFSQLSGITATEGVESEANHHPLLIHILADEMKIQRKLIQRHNHYFFFDSKPFPQPSKFVISNWQFMILKSLLLVEHAMNLSFHLVSIILKCLIVVLLH